MSDSSEAAS